MRISPPKNFNNRRPILRKQGMARGKNLFRPRGEEGFSLVEAVVTLFLVGVLAAVFLVFVRQGMRTSTAALHVSDATSVASSLMAEIMTRLNDEDSGTVQQGGREYQWVVEILPILGEQTESVDLTIAWTEAAGPQRMTISTLRAIERAGLPGQGLPESGSGADGSSSESEGDGGSSGDSPSGSGGVGEDGPSS